MLNPKVIMTLIAALVGAGGAFGASGDAPKPDAIPPELVSALSAVMSMVAGWLVAKLHVPQPESEVWQRRLKWLGGALATYAVSAAGMQGLSPWWAFGLALSGGVLGGIAFTQDVPKISAAGVTGLLALALLGGCGGTMQRVDWGGIVKCAANEVPALIATVGRILLNDRVGQSVIGPDAKQELLELGKMHGVDAVSCAVQRFIDDARAPRPGGGSRSYEYVFAADRGEDFLSGQDTRVEVAP